MENKNKFNDLSKVPVELYDDGVNYGMIYNIQASEEVLEDVAKLMDGFYELCGGSPEDEDWTRFVLLSFFLFSINGADGEWDSEGNIIGYDKNSDELEIFVNCRGNAIIPFRDALLKRFPEISYIEVYN